MRLLKRKKNGGFAKLSRKQKKEIKDYWKQFDKKINTDWVAYFYGLSGIYDYRYIPESYYYSEIQPYLNNQKIGWALSDKNIMSQIFNAKMPKTVARKIDNQFFSCDYEVLSYQETLDRIVAERRVILKPAKDTYGGEGILFWDETKTIDELRDYLNDSNDLIIQEIIEQHSNLSKYHKNSLNTIRIVTLKTEADIVVLNSLLRMGVNDSKIDNFSAGGIIANLYKDGSLFPENIQANGESITVHPTSKVKFDKKKVINYKGIVESAKIQHKRVPYFKMIAWDYAIDINEEPILIEANYPSGQLDFHQLNKGSIFGKYTDYVLREVYKSK